MEIRILAFATARDALGSDRLELEVPPGTRVGDLRSALGASHPGLEELWPRLAVAVDGRIADASTEITEGSEVALLPPVSGGEGRGWLTDDPLDPGAVAERVAEAGRGAVVLFLGTVRNESRGRRVTELTYSAYRRMAADRLERIAAELEEEAPGLAVAIGHRLGPLAPGEISVVIATASPHREAAYVANRRALERLKREVPVWKRERYADGSEVWREEERLEEPQRESSETARVG